MSGIAPMKFQEEHIKALLARFDALRGEYGKLGAKPEPKMLDSLRKQSACVMLQAPTGIGKTLMACELMLRFTPRAPILWFWFAPFAGIIGQAERALKRQAPRLPQLSAVSDRRPEKITPGSVFVLTWQTVAARSRDSRLARTSGDAGLAVDDLIVLARDQGLRIGVVVDEAHHGFVHAPEACRFFSEVLAPDYALLMTATPRDNAATKFASMTGYRIGGPSEWASVTRAEGVQAQLLKKSVKASRFIAKNQDDAQLISFEEVALSECASMHRHLKQMLKKAGIGLTPLMLVQVPNGGAAMQVARRYLVDVLRFPDEAVKAHTANEPDPNLAALADDPQVEVILFKMAIATGFDAPRAFTLAALRGTRDVSFGIQVVGRIMRVHRLLQGRLKDLAPELSYGYVFLANSEAQEGLTGAASEINSIPEHLASAGTTSVVTVIADSPFVQLVRPGESLSLVPSAESDVEAPARFVPTEAGNLPAPTSQQSLFAGLVADRESPSAGLFARGYTETSRLTETLTLDAQRPPRRYRKRPGTPTELVTEVLPDLPDDFEERLVGHIDFKKILGDRMKVRSMIVERTTDVFTASTPEDRDIWATVSSAAIADKARQLAFEFEDVDRREFWRALKNRFMETLLSEGHSPPDSEEELTRQLELVLVRNPRLIREANKRVRAQRVIQMKVLLRDALESEEELEPAARNVYGVFPPDLSPAEREFADVLDTAEEVLWWHRNRVRKADSVAVYDWGNGGGVGFYPDFVIGVAGRQEGHGAALTELKGAHLLQYDKEKAGAIHPEYGRVFMVGKEQIDGSFRLWRLAQNTLVDDGPFEVRRLRYS